MAGNRLLSEIARKRGGQLLDAAIDKVLPGETLTTAKRKTLLGGIAGAMAIRIATRSVPGAIVVGGAVLAKKLYDRRHAKRSPAKGKDAPGT